MNDKYEAIWDFCDWLRRQGLAYETIYYGCNEDLDRLIKLYLADDEWFKEKELEE